MSIIDFFPHRNFRQFQKETLEIIQESFDNQQEYIILESPTGSGKSAIAISLGLYNQPGYLLTSQKILQEQYTRDYGSDDICVLKGRSNYPCAFWRGNASCAEGVCLAGKRCMQRQECEYNVAKAKAVNAKIALMNYSYFLTSMEYTETFEDRKILIMDEAQNVESEIMRFIEVSFSSYILSKIGVTSKIPVYEKIENYVEWVQSIQSKVVKLIIEIEQKIQNMSADDYNYNQKKIVDLQYERDLLISQREKTNKFLNSYSDTEWIFDIIEGEKLDRKTIYFKPLTVVHFTKDLLLKYGSKKFLMSATILDKDNFCKTLGINPDNAKFIQLPSTFSKDIRPIIITNTGNMGKDNLDQTLPKIAEDITKMLQYHKNEKGLVHCHTYKIARYIQDNVDPLQAQRLIFHTGDDREERLDEFLHSQEPKVLVTPSMTEGIDLKDDLARFVVIVKIPFLYLGDKQIKRRTELDDEWYKWRAALSLVQASGRGVRHQDDFCITYIMDSGIKFFIKNNRKFFPDYFVEAIKN